MKALLFIQSFSIWSPVYPFPYLIVVFVEVVYTFPNLLAACSFGYNLKPLLFIYHWFCSHPIFPVVDGHSLSFSLVCGQCTCKSITSLKVIVIVSQNMCIFQNYVLSTPITKCTYSKLRCSMICVLFILIEFLHGYMCFKV